MKVSKKFFLSISTRIVERRKLFYLIFAVLFIYCLFSITKVNINYEIASYLPDDAETKKSLSVMEEEFVTFGSAKIMVSNVTIEVAEDIYEGIKNLDVQGIKAIEFENTEEYYKNSNALYVVTFDSEDGSDRIAVALKGIREYLDSYDVNILAVESDSSFADQLSSDMLWIMLAAAGVILLILIFSSKSYMEIPIFLIVFMVAAVLNMGTNYMFGEISFISSSVAIILQLALAIDYAIILSHRFIEEREVCTTTKEAVIVALSKAIPEIFASSLTTVSGLVAMMFMQLKIGYDLGAVLTKGIIFSLLTVFVLMPGLLMLFDKPMRKTMHKNFVPNIDKLGKLVVKLRYITPVIFLVLMIGGAVMQGSNEYVFSENAIDPIQKTESRVQREEIEAVFGRSNALAVLVPVGDYEKEREVIKMLESKDLVISAIGLSSIELADGVYLTDNVSVKEFATVLGIDKSTARTLFYAYAVSKEEFGIVTNIDAASVPMLDMIDFMYENLDVISSEIDPEKVAALGFVQSTD
jgi:predicted RND superfamily exporter protein